MLYFDTATSDIFRRSVSMIANLALWPGGVVAERFGEPAGRVVAAAAVYASIAGLIFFLLPIGLITKHLVFHMSYIFKRGFAG